MKKLNLLLSLGVTFLLTVTSAQPQTSGPADAAPLLVQMVRLPGDNAPSRIVRVPANRALARVNGEAITLSDLLPVSDPPTSAEYILSPERYASRLDRAIERVLTRQAAQAEGIVLSADQQRQRDRVRERLLASEGAAGDVIHLNRIGTLEGEIAFQQREAASQLLLNSLLAKAGAASPHVTEDQVNQYYEAHRADFAALPSEAGERAKARQQIDLAIRQKLVLANTAEHQAQRRQFLNSLRAKAAVTTVKTIQ